jgi:hypothetical protein
VEKRGGEAEERKNRRGTPASREERKRHTNTLRLDKMKEKREEAHKPP